MASIFEALRQYGPAAFVLKAIIASIGADALFLLVILVRRFYRKRYFARRDARVLELRQEWSALISGEIPYERWRRNSFDRCIVQDLVLDAFESSGPQDSARLLRFLRASGLIEKQIFEARKHRGWRRRRSLVALGRTRAPEGIPALSEALRDNDAENRNAALRGLGRVGSPEAAEEILTWVAESGLKVPALPLQNALVNCCRERPQVLLPYLQYAEGPVREVLGRVLGEVAGPSLGAEVIPLAEDALPELRASAARALSHAHSGHALEVLSELARDPVWFVRLRAVVALGELHEPKAIPQLLLALTDANRLVRMRAAEGLVALREEMVPIFAQVVATHDKYGLHAYLAALENLQLRLPLETELAKTASLGESGKEVLLRVVRSGELVEEPVVALQ